MDSDPNKSDLNVAFFKERIFLSIFSFSIFYRNMKGNFSFTTRVVM